MLTELHIKNVALVDELTLSFTKGLNIITGETGAGKSVIVGAIMQVLGERADSKMIREGAENASMEGAFDCTGVKVIRKTLDERGIEIGEDEAVIIKREISADGKSKCHINGHITPLSTVKEIGDSLVDIHSQNDHQSLLKKSVHLNLLDSYGGLLPERANIAVTYSTLKQLRSEREEINRTSQDNERMREMYEFYLKEIDTAELKAGEEEELRNRKRMLSNSEKLHELLNSICSMIKDDDGSVADKLHSAIKALTEAAAIDERLAGALKLVEDGLVSIEEAAAASRESANSLDFNADELEAIEARLDLVFSLKRKYGQTIEDILKYRDEIAEKLRKITHREDEIERLNSEIEQQEKALASLAALLSKKRKKCASELAGGIEKQLKQLGMEHCKFQVGITIQEANSTGIDDVDFLISPNLGERLKPLREIASSGEISRIMLAIRTVIGENDSTPVLIFDEIDVNIGGNTATIVGEKLAQLGAKRQIICITHLPQVAKFANAHFCVRKEVKGHRTTTTVERLNEKERIEELTRMMGASPDEKATVQLAKTMLKNTKEGK
jgi:DNA repair protein RecN (Recombination protein N)